MHPGADSVVLDAVLEPSAAGAACAFNLCVNQAPNDFAPGERIAADGYAVHLATSCQSTETSRPAPVRIHRREDLVRALTISAPVRCCGPVPLSRCITSTAAAARLRW